jgi:glycoside hydrolase-like protein
MIIADYTYRINPAVLKAAGIAGVVRYLCPLGEPKRILRPEADEILGAGLSLTLVYENRADDWLTGNGATDGLDAVRQARALLYGRNCTILTAADFDQTRDQFLSRGRGYAAAFYRVVHLGGYRMGVYGSSDTLTWCHDDGIMDVGWQAGLSKGWSEGRNASRSAFADLMQDRQATVGGATVDLSTAYVDDWGQYIMSLTTDDLGKIRDAVWHLDIDSGPDTVSAGTALLGVRAGVDDLLTRTAPPVGGAGFTLDDLRRVVREELDRRMPENPAP